MKHHLAKFCSIVKVNAKIIARDAHILYIVIPVPILMGKRHSKCLATSSSFIEEGPEAAFATF